MPTRLTAPKAAAVVSLEDFESRCSGQKPNFEYGKGLVPKQKSTPTFLHGLIQSLVMILLREAGYKAATEVELRVSNDWHPIPDVIGVTILEHPYPTKPVDIVVEILSPDDRMGDVLVKCGEYSRLGIKAIAVVDPEHRFGLEWEPGIGTLQIINKIVLPNGRTLDLNSLWERLDQEIS